jgi:voltage-dependent potassium channel beta subunit
MIYRRLGESGLKISSLGLGGWITFGEQIDAAETRRVVAAAVDAGINFFDLADVYARGAAEEAFGTALTSYPRSSLVVSSKAFWPVGDGPNDRGLSRKHLFESVDGTLARLGTDYLDIYFCHRHDPTVEVEEVVMAMDDLVRQGKILYWGTSVWPASRLVEAAFVARGLGAHPPRVEQPRYNMLDRHIEEEIAATASRFGMGLVVWSPLAHGVLSGKYANGIPEDSRAGRNPWVRRNLDEHAIKTTERLRPIAEQLGVSLAQLALAWCLRLPEVTSVITGASRPEQVIENVKALELTLSDETLKRIEKVLGNRPAPPPD